MLEIGLLITEVLKKPEMIKMFVFVFIGLALAFKDTKSVTRVLTTIIIFYGLMNLLIA